MRPTRGYDRRSIVLGLAAGAACGPVPLRAQTLQLKTIPKTGERIPAIGMGTWLTFDVGSDPAARAQRVEVVRAFFAAGGRLIDSSPMYGSSPAVIGAALARLGKPSALFAADKVWTTGAEAGLAQIGQSRERWAIPRFDLLQVHNLLDWRTQLATLFRLKAERRLRYVGITSYDGYRYDEMEAIMRAHPLDFVQLSYNIADRRAEARLLPLAADRGIAVIANRPFQEGRLIAATRGRRLPALAAELGADGWAQVMLKFIISHPAITVTIPATRRVDHMRQNMAAMAGTLPDATNRARMAAAFEA